MLLLILIRFKKAWWRLSILPDQQESKLGWKIDIITTTSLLEEMQVLLDICDEDWWGFQYDCGHAQTLDALGLCNHKDYFSDIPDAS